jgi:hypothetical protein
MDARLSEWVSSTAPRRHVCYIRHISGFSLALFLNSKVNLMMQLNCHIVKVHGGGVECVYVCELSIFYSNRWVFNIIIECAYWNEAFFKGWHIKQNSIDFYRLPQTHLLWRHATLYALNCQRREKFLLLSTFWWFHYGDKVTVNSSVD